LLCLRDTEVDPYRNGVLLAHFSNVRDGQPDIDADFEYEQRYDIIQ
jgi:DNA polymerase III alpha subunit